MREKSPEGGNRDQTTFCSRVITYTYTPAGQVAGITDSQGNLLATTDAKGQTMNMT